MDLQHQALSILVSISNFLEKKKKKNPNKTTDVSFKTVFFKKNK